MTYEEMKATFQIGDIVERKPEFMESYNGETNHKVKVTGLRTGCFLEVSGHVDAGNVRQAETMRVIERDGIRIGDFVRPYHNKSTHCIYRFDSFDKDGWVYATGVEGDNTPLWLPCFRRMTDQEVAEHVPPYFGERPAIKTLGETICDQLSYKLSALDAKQYIKKVELDPFMVGSDERKMEVSIKTASAKPYSLGDVYQDLLANLNLYNDMAKKEQAPLFELLQVGTQPK